MALALIGSTNPNFSHIIGKNPASGMQAKPVRSGIAMGWFHPDSQCYNVFFKELSDESSYSNTDGIEYINSDQYTSPIFYMNINGDFFGGAIKEHHVLDENPKIEGVPKYINYYKLFAIECQPKYLSIFEKSFDGRFGIESRLVCNNTYNITISTSETIRELLAFVNVFCSVNAIKLGYRVNGESEVEKYSKGLEMLDLPYFVRYIFKVQVMYTTKLFEKYKSLLEKSKRHIIELQPGYNFDNRFAFIKDNLNLTKPVVDFGCGEGNYVFKLAKKMGEIPYIAIDSDEEKRNGVVGKAKHRQLENVKVYDKLPDNLPEHSQVIVSEVVEHMEISEAEAILNKIASNPNVDKIIITTPNVWFNKYYFMEEGEVRHEDHKIELDPFSFTKLLQRCSNGKTLTIQELGDKVDGISSTIGGILQ